MKAVGLFWLPNPSPATLNLQAVSVHGTPSSHPPAVLSLYHRRYPLLSFFSLLSRAIALTLANLPLSYLSREVVMAALDFPKTSGYSLFHIYNKNFFFLPMCWSVRRLFCILAYSHCCIIFGTNQNYFFPYS